VEIDLAVWLDGVEIVAVGGDMKEWSGEIGFAGFDNFLRGVTTGLESFGGGFDVIGRD